MRLISLEELAQQEHIDVSEVGLKAQGLVDLLRAAPKFARFEKDRYDDDFFVGYHIPPGYVVPKSWDGEGLRAVFDELTSSFEEYGVLLARSSSVNEEPGVFPTLFSMYTKGQEEESYSAFESAVNHVREKAGSVVIQPLVGEVTYLETEDISVARGFLTGKNDFDKMEKDVSLFLEREDLDWEGTWEKTVYYEGDEKWDVIFEPRREKVEAVFAEELEHFKDPEYYQHMDIGHWDLDKIELELRHPVRSLDPVFGENVTSFVIRSHSHMDPSKSSLNFCYGLPTRLVEDPSQICIIEMGRDPDQGIGLPISTGNSYHGKSQAYIQDSQDVFSIDAGKVESRGFSRERHEPFRDLFIPRYIKPHLWNLFDMVQYFSDELGCPVEMEGMVDEEQKLYVFQLTRSHLLENAIEHLTPVDKKRICMKYDSGLGSINFSGDVVAHFGNSEKLEEVRSRYPNGGVLSLSSEFPKEELGFTTYVRVQDTEGVLRGLSKDRSRFGYANVHAIGHLTSQIYARTQQGDNVCAVMEYLDYTKLKKRLPRRFHKRREKIRGEDIWIFKDVTVEQVGGKFQMYFNE